MSKIRVSAATLAMTIQNRDTGAVAYFGLLNKGSLEKKQQRLFTPPGGGLLVKCPEGDQILSAIGAEFERPIQGWGRDARFVLPEEHLETALTFCSDRSSGLIEKDPRRELLEELTKKEMAIQKSPLLTFEEFDQLGMEFLSVYRQPDPEEGKGTSANETDIPTRRVFHLFSLSVPNALWEKLRGSPVVAFLTAEEVATTNGGRNKGTAADGSAIGDNMFLIS